jgi:methyl-accepting chemotaxis protein
MSENNPFGFAKLVPGFDFLQNLAKGASQNLPHMPSLSSWVAPTINVEELDKRIGELKAVHFWLDQNSKALGATIQALEVQKMTLATLQGMNFSMGDVANALKLKTVEKVASGVQKVSDAADAVAGAAEAARRKSEPAAKKARPAKGDGSAGAAPVDPMQWWGALTQQFQESPPTR